MVTPIKTGPLTFADLQEIWESTSDPGYVQSLEQAGEGNGFEVYGQMFAQYGRISQAIDTSTQAMFALPWSGQSAPPADYGQKATVTLTLSRTLLPQLPLVLPQGWFVEELAQDWGYPQGIQRKTGRRYALAQNLVFEPGQQGPLTVGAIAEFPGYGYNNPQPGTISLIDNPGSRFNNTNASVRVSTIQGPIPPGFSTSVPATVVYVDCTDVPDVFVPGIVGEYLSFTAGLNKGTTARIIGYQQPNLSAVPPIGGTVQLAFDQSIEAFSGHFASSPTFQPGELLVFTTAGPTLTGTGVVIDAQVIGGNLFLTFQATSGAATLGCGITGTRSGASVTSVGLMLSSPTFVPENPITGTGATWMVLDWKIDWGMVSTNVASPTGGVAAFLNALGKEKNVFPQAGEPSSKFRQRVAVLSDVVSPNAILRAANRVLQGTHFCFREVGQPSLPGFFYDGETAAHSIPSGLFTPDAYDYDVVDFFVGSSSSYTPNERLIYKSATGALKGFGFFGRFTMGTGIITMIRTGLNVVTPATFAPGDVIVGVSSGIVTPIFSATTYATTIQYRFHEYFDYTDFRAMFMIGVAPQDIGDFGFFYDGIPQQHSGGFYDMRPYALGFYDGFALMLQHLCLQLYNDILPRKAGGVGFYIYPEMQPNC